MFYGPGAGELPTANSVLSDITSVTKNIVMGTTGFSFNDYTNELELADDSEVVYPYYLSLQVLDKPGQMLKLTEIMTEYDASFRLITQTQMNDRFARVSMVTHEMSESQLNHIVEKLNELEEISVLAAYKVLTEK